mmetsp:Transcript_48024/g.104446  ORF Transcript_48024/g.104446 Transcript_48024/m.104446 type:complete len:208 (-) Transcript_48024:719-1342(-)
MLGHSAGARWMRPPTRPSQCRSASRALCPCTRPMALVDAPSIRCGWNGCWAPKRICSISKWRMPSWTHASTPRFVGTLRGCRFGVTRLSSATCFGTTISESDSWLKRSRGLARSLQPRPPPPAERRPQPRRPRPRRRPRAAPRRPPTPTSTRPSRPTRRVIAGCWSAARPLSRAVRPSARQCSACWWIAASRRATCPSGSWRVVADG